TITGNAGANVLSGGLGDDTFMFTTALTATNVDAIQDFGAASGDDDRIGLDNAIFAKLGAAGPLDADDFYLVGSPPARGTSFIGYDQATGFLYYDSNGTLLPGGDTHFATLTNKPVLT